MCGVHAAISKGRTPLLPQTILDGLALLQHRGKDGYGIVWSCDGKCEVLKAPGLVSEATLSLKHADAYLGHNRYSTSGGYMEMTEVSLCEQQPLRGEMNGEPFWLVHNGNIPGIDGHDTQQILRQISSFQTDNMESALISLVKLLPAAYSLIVLFRGTLYGVRDRFGVRPLCIGENEEAFFLSSETRGLGKVPAVRNVSPGEVVRLGRTLESVYVDPSAQLSLCTFELLYFSHEDSILDGYHVKAVREKLANVMATKEAPDIVSSAPVVVGVPETGITLGQAYARTLGLDYAQLISTAPKATRTFIAKTSQDRRKGCLDKFVYNERELCGRDVVIVDDTIVRGTVISAIIERLNGIGVRKIHVRIPAPPVIDVCYMGIAIRSKDELIKHGRSIEQVREKIGANTLSYPSVEEVAQFVPKKSYNHCFSGRLVPSMLSSISTGCHNQDTSQTSSLAHRHF